MWPTLPEPAAPEATVPGAGTAPLGPRATAAAADAAIVLLTTALAILGARILSGSSPRLSGLPWALAFLAYLSFFATVPALVLFGRTVGMTLADLSARADADGGMPAVVALGRWIGTIVTAATAGLALLWTVRDPSAPTPADRLSGRSLTVD